MVTLPPAKDAICFAQMVADNLDWTRDQTWDFRLWLFDRFTRGWVKLFHANVPRGTIVEQLVGGIIWRPVSVWPSDITDLWSYDEKGTNMWVDFLYAPGHWALVKQFLKTLPFNEAGWQHRSTCAVHIIQIKKLL
jgi:hypothetical protein